MRTNLGHSLITSVSVWDTLYLGTGTFREGTFVTWDILLFGTFGGLGRLVVWNIWLLGTFTARDVHDGTLCNSLQCSKYTMCTYRWTLDGSLIGSNPGVGIRPTNRDAVSSANFNKRG